MITSKGNEQVKAAIRLRESAKERGARGLFFLEGFRLCMDAIASGYVPQAIFITEAARTKYDISGADAILVSEIVAQKLADTKTPQGIFGVFGSKAKQDFWQSGARYIALEQVQDPGNLGAIARTAEALGLDGLLVGGGCDVYHPKALRASMGSLLRLPVLECDDLVKEIASCDLQCYAAVPGEGAVSINNCDFSNGAVILIGNEGSGLSENAIKACDMRVTIPMPGKAESLNAAAAAAILMWEMMKSCEIDARTKPLQK